METGLTFGEALKVVRISRTNLSARGLSLAAGLSESYMGKVESDSLDPSLRSFVKISSVLQLTPLEVQVLMKIASS